MRWAELQPNRCKLSPEFGNPNLIVVDTRTSPIVPTSLNHKVYLVFAPHIEQYVNVRSGIWQMGDWKTVGVAPGLEEVDFTGMCHLMIGIIEALKEIRQYTPKQGLPPISHPDQAYSVALEKLTTLLTYLEAKTSIHSCLTIKKLQS